jgi:hypothetical protein
MNRAKIFRFEGDRRNNSAALTNGQNLIHLHRRESFDFLRGWPFHFHHVDGLRLAHTKVQPQVALRHHAGVLKKGDARFFANVRIADGNGGTLSFWSLARKQEQM